ncbi:MAG: hypothetical protein J6M59_10625 [Bacteroidaceae bacterium]|nr:hypothetical protein [Bacteroidaceae bacterium]
MKHLLTLIVGLLFTSLLFSCKTQKQVETVYINNTRIIEDTIFKWDVDTVLDSVVVTKTDTLTMYEKYRTRIQKKVEYKTKYQTDTVVRTEYKTVTKTEYKDKPLKWWQKILIYIGVIVLAIEGIGFARRFR